MSSKKAIFPCLYLCPLLQSQSSVLSRLVCFCSQLLCHMRQRRIVNLMLLRKLVKFRSVVLCLHSFIMCLSSFVLCLRSLILLKTSLLLSKRSFSFWNLLSAFAAASDATRFFSTSSPRLNPMVYSISLKLLVKGFQKASANCCKPKHTILAMNLTWRI